VTDGVRACILRLCSEIHKTRGVIMPMYLFCGKVTFLFIYPYLLYVFYLLLIQKRLFLQLRSNKEEKTDEEQKISQRPS